MIRSKKDLDFYLKEDAKALGINFKYTSWLTLFNPYNIDLEIWKFQRQLRICEYFYNVNRNDFFWKIKKFFVVKRFKKLSLRNNFTINPNCFGPGLRIMHRGTIVVNGNCKIGSNCTINACVNIGVHPNFEEYAPQLGNNIYIGPGAKIYGKIDIADNCMIGANAVVNKSELKKGTVLIGIPAKPKNGQ